MQEIQLYSDATFFENSLSSEKFACGASIIRYKDYSDPIFTQNKYIYAFSAEHSSHAELVTGINVLRPLFKSRKNPLVQWRCDLPYLNDLLLKEINLENEESNESPNRILKEIQKIHTTSLLTVHTPKTSQEIHYHTLCHRVCRMIRPLIEEIQKNTTELSIIRKEIESYLKKRNSPWKFLYPNIIYNEEGDILLKN
jgi:hypothetical protein